MVDRRVSLKPLYSSVLVLENPWPVCHALKVALDTLSMCLLCEYSTEFKLLHSVDSEECFLSSPFKRQKLDILIYCALLLWVLEFNSWHFFLIFSVSAVFRSFSKQQTFDWWPTINIQSELVSHFLFNFECFNIQVDLILTLLLNPQQFSLFLQALVLHLGKFLNQFS